MACFTDLPESIRFHIASYLSFRDRIRPERVSKSWKNALRTCWLTVDEIDLMTLFPSKKQPDIDEQELKRREQALEAVLVRAHKQVDRITCAGFNEWLKTNAMTSNIMKTITSHSSSTLLVVDLSIFPFYDWTLLESLLLLPEHLEELHLAVGSLHPLPALKPLNNAFRNISIRFIRLRALSISFKHARDYQHNISEGVLSCIRWPCSLRTLCLMRAKILDLDFLRCLPALREFYVSDAALARHSEGGLFEIPEPHLSAIGDCPLLEKLSVRSTDELENITLPELPELTYLDLSESQGIMCDQVKSYCSLFRNLTHLNIKGNALYEVGSEALSCIGTLRDLRYLNAEVNYFLSDDVLIAICEGCKKLEEFYLTFNHGLTPVGYRSVSTLPKLRRFATDGEKLNQEVLQLIIDSCTELSHLVIRKIYDFIPLLQIPMRLRFHYPKNDMEDEDYFSDCSCPVDDGMYL